MQIRLRDWIGAEQVRSIQFGIFADARNPYLRAGPFGDAEARKVEQRIRNVRDRKLRRIIDAVPPFSAATLRQAWSLFMALGAGTHPWPDANHRTAFLSFDLAVRHALQTSVGLDAAAAQRMVEQSKAMRDAAYLERNRYYTVAELRDPDHPYRQLLTSFESHLLVRSIR